MLQKLNFRPGFNKQATASGAESQWIDGDFVRFRYGLPEKIGGWQQLSLDDKTLPGVARAVHNFTSLAGEAYTAIGTSQGLFLYYDESFFDISPLDTALTSCTFTTTNSSATVTINKTSHGLQAGRYITLSSVASLPGGGVTSFTAGVLEKSYEILTVATNSFTILASATETGTGMSAQGSVSVNPYAIVGPTIQTIGYGWGTDAYSAGTWGTESSVSDVTLDPGNWSLSNFGQVLVATIHNGKTFTWDAGASSARSVRAASNTSGFSVTNNPTQSVMTIVSDRDRHLFHMGTETTIGTGSTQDPMFVRFSNQEDLNTYTPTATNTAGTFRLDDGNEIVTAVQGKDYILILTDTAAYVVQFVGPPFTFSVKQVGTNCGCISQHGAVYAQGAVYWMGKAGGFYVYDGTVKSLPCLVEDFVFTTDGDNLGINFGSSKTVYAGHNSLYTEVNWFYPKSESVQIDRCVTYNYAEGVWTTSSLDRSTYADASTYPVPYATEYSATGTPTFPTLQGATNTFGATTYYAQEVGINKIDLNKNATAIAAFVQSGDFDLPTDGDGSFLLRISRFLPDFKNIQGNAKITLGTKDFPVSTNTTTTQFDVSGTTSKIDTRVRGRLANLKIENTSTNESWRYGTFRADVYQDGRR